MLLGEFLLESTPTLDAMGVPRDTALEMMKSLRLRHDHKFKEIENPKEFLEAGVPSGNAVLQLPDGVWGYVHSTDEPRYSDRGWHATHYLDVWTLYTFKDGEYLEKNRVKKGSLPKMFRRAERLFTFETNPKQHQDARAIKSNAKAVRADNRYSNNDWSGFSAIALVMTYLPYFAKKMERILNKMGRVAGRLLNDEDEEGLLEITELMTAARKSLKELKSSQPPFVYSGRYSSRYTTYDLVKEIKDKNENSELDFDHPASDEEFVAVKNAIRIGVKEYIDDNVLIRFRDKLKQIIKDSNARIKHNKELKGEEESGNDEDDGLKYASGFRQWAKSPSMT